MDLKNLKVVAISFFLPLVGSWVIVQSQFWAGAVIADGAICFLFPFAGAVVLSKIKFKSQFRKAAVITSYVFFMLVIVWFIVLLTSCANGDCI